ncbi:MAG: hypothetical protein R6X23_05780 [Acidimicrobiia bacterium]
MSEPSESETSTRARYEAQAQAALERLRGQVDELRVQADLAQAEARDRLHQGLEALRARQAEAKTKLDEAQAAGTDAWKARAAQAEAVVDDLGETFSKLATDVQVAVDAAATAASKARAAFLEEWNKLRSERSSLLDDE